LRAYLFAAKKRLIASRRCASVRKACSNCHRPLAMNADHSSFSLICGNE
jgi:hypothetical protein